MDLFKNDKIQNQFNKNFTESRLVITKEIRQIEEKKRKFQKQLDILEDKEQIVRSKITFKTTTRDYNDKGATDSIYFDTSLMKEYIKNEIDLLQEKSNILVRKLK